MEFPSLSASEPPVQKSLNSSGRWDVLCRCISAAKRLHLIVDDLTFYGFLTKGTIYCLSILSTEWDQWSFSEVGNASRIQKILQPQDHGSEAEDLSLLINSLVTSQELLYLLEEGGPFLPEVLEDKQQDAQYTFLLGSERGYSSTLKSTLSLLPNYQEVSLGPKSYLASQCITLLGYYLTYQTPVR